MAKKEDPSAEDTQIKQQFAEADADHDDRVSLDEFMNYRKVGVVKAIFKRLDEFTEGNGYRILDFVDKIFGAADTSKDNLVTYEEWKDGFKALKSGATEEEIRTIFEATDIDQSGTISVSELKGQLEKA